MLHSMILLWIYWQIKNIQICVLQIHLKLSNVLTDSSLDDNIFNEKLFSIYSNFIKTKFVNGKYSYL